MKLWVIRDGAYDGPTNMARDEYLLQCRRLRPAVLRFYRWQPATLSLGCFQRYRQIAELPPEVSRLPVVRRPTGGGAILHDRELTYCLVIDEALDAARQPPTFLYRLVHDLWRRVLAEAGIRSELAPDHYPLPSPRSGPFFCFEKPGHTDLLVGNLKLLGSAQRRVAGQVLQHGSLLLGKRFAVHPGGHLGDPPADVVRGWTQRFVELLAERLGLEPANTTWPAEAEPAVAELRRKYAGEAWTRRR